MFFRRFWYTYIDMARSNLPKSIRKYLRKEKSRLRQGRFSGSSEAVKEIETKIQELAAKIRERYTKSNTNLTSTNNEIR